MKNGSSNDGSVHVKVTGCEYKVSEEKLRDALSKRGTIKSEIKEELFLDPMTVTEQTEQVSTY